MLPVYDIAFPYYPESARGTNRRVVDIEWEACPLAGSTTIRFFLEALETYIEQRARGLHRVVGISPSQFCVGEVC